jgi:mRNA-degrading endonuclease toxin of MazEF toxin-antitoxin module
MKKIIASATLIVKAAKKARVQKVEVQEEVRAPAGEIVDVNIPGTIPAGSTPKVEVTSEDNAVEVVQLANAGDHIVAKCRVSKTVSKKRIPFTITVTTPKKKIVAQGVMNVKPAPAPKAAAPKKPAVISIGDVDAAAGEVDDIRLVVPWTCPKDAEPEAAFQVADQAAMTAISVGEEGDKTVVVARVECSQCRAYPFTMDITAGDDKVKVKGVLNVKSDVAQVIMMLGMVGRSTTEDKLQIRRTIKEPTTYSAHFDPPTRKFRVTPAKGALKRGAKTFPFRVIYTPTEPVRSIVHLIVTFGEDTDNPLEKTYVITGTIAGLEGRTWSSRLHKKLQPTASYEDDDKDMPALPEGRDGRALTSE